MNPASTSPSRLRSPRRALGFAVSPLVVAIGEVGLAGELRAVPAMARRVQEAARLGAKAVIVPAASDVAEVNGVELWRCESLREALTAAQPAQV